MHHVFALFIGFEQWPNQQHGGTGGADETGQQAACQNERGVGARVGPQVAGNANATANDIQTKQQRDKWNELTQQGVFGNCLHDRPVETAADWVGYLVHGPVSFDGRGMHKPII
jgi:hypothetical protein